MIALIRLQSRKNDWAVVNTVPKDLSIGGDYYDYVSNVVKRTDGKVKYFENEWEADCVKKHWSGTAEQYAQLTKTFYRAVKDANTDALVIIGSANGDLGSCNSFTTQVLNYLAAEPEESFDLFDMHLYHHSTEDNLMQLYNIPERVRYYRNLMDSYTRFKDKPIVVTEYGGPSPTEFAYVDKAKYSDLTNEINTNSCVLSTDLKSTSLHPEGYPDQFRMFAYGIEPELDKKRDRIQGRQMVYRTFLALSEGVKRLYWWNIKSTEPPASQTCYFRHPFYGKMQLMTRDGSGNLVPLPTFYYYQTMAFYLKDATTVKRVSTVDDNRFYLFEVVRNDNSKVYVVWEKRDQFYGEDQPAVEFSFNVPWQQVKTKDLFGAEKIMPALNGQITLSIIDTPVFVEPLPATSVESEGESESIPQEFLLYQNYPNPFNPTTTIRFTIPKRERVTLKVFDTLGREVATLVNGELNPGEHSVVYDARGLPSGVYFYRLTTPTFSQTKSMAVIK